MTNQQHPIIPSPELVQQWWEEADQYQDDPKTYFDHVATEAARWGADQELEACCKCINDLAHGADAILVDLRAARRPKPPSLKEQALAKLEAMERLWEASGNTPSDIVRRALEQLDG